MIFRWFGRKPPEPNTNRLLQTARAVIADFGELIENEPGVGVIKDVKRLPHDKEVVLNSMFLAMVAPDCPENMREALKVAADALAYFQDGIGKDLHPFGVNWAEMSKLDAEAGLALMTANENLKARYDQMLPLVNLDRARISERIAQAELLIKDRGMQP